MKKRVFSLSNLGLLALILTTAIIVIIGILVLTPNTYGKTERKNAVIRYMYGEKDQVLKYDEFGKVESYRVTLGGYAKMVDKGIIDIDDCELAKEFMIKLSAVSDK